MADLQQCMTLLRKSKSDSERMAVLMLVVKCVQAESITDEQKEELFHAISPGFILKLLNCATISDHRESAEDKMIYRALGKM